MKNLLGEAAVEDEAEGDGPHDWRFSLLFTAEKKLLTTKEPVDDGLRSTMGREGCLLAGHSPLFLLIFTCFGRLFS
jgi:hypothetical protein